MVRSYRYLFYRLFEWGRRVNGMVDEPHYSAAFGLSIVATTNVFNVVMAVEVTTGAASIGSHAMALALICGAAALAFHYLAFIQGDKLEQLCDEMDGVSVSFGMIAFAWLYPILSTAMFFVLLALRE